MFMCSCSSINWEDGSTGVEAMTWAGKRVILVCWSHMWCPRYSAITSTSNPNNVPTLPRSVCNVRMGVRVGPENVVEKIPLSIREIRNLSRNGHELDRKREVFRAVSAYAPLEGLFEALPDV
jgi:hypothetical protein